MPAKKRTAVAKPKQTLPKKQKKPISAKSHSSKPALAKVKTLSTSTVKKVRKPLSAVKKEVVAPKEVSQERSTTIVSNWFFGVLMALLVFTLVSFIIIFSALALLKLGQEKDVPKENNDDYPVYITTNTPETKNPPQLKPVNTTSSPQIATDTATLTLQVSEAK